LIFELRWIDADAVVILSHEAAARRCPEVIRPLRRGQPFAIHDELVALRLATEDGMILENEARQFGIAVVEAQGRRQSADSTAHYDTVEDLIGRGRFDVGEDIVPDLVACMDNFVSVPV
jgi:hypothetical protein